MYEEYIFKIKENLDYFTLNKNEKKILIKTLLKLDKLYNYKYHYGSSRHDFYKIEKYIKKIEILTGIYSK